MKWTYEDRDYLSRHYADRSVAQFAAHLGRTEGAIRQQLRFLGISKRRCSLLTVEELAFLKKNAGKMNAKLIARELGRTVDAIYQTAHRLDISLKVKPPQSVIDQMRRLRSDGCTYDAIGAVFPQYTRSTIWRYINA